jgi:phenylalanyl-tRNA synthetase beta subunit
MPIAVQDVALVVASDVSAAALEQALVDGAGDLLESIVLFQDETLEKIYKIDKGCASQGMSNGTYKIVVQTQSEILKMLQPESEGT